MKGIVLAGGNGNRLYPLTKVTNKALLPAYSKPMIYWPIETLVKSGIREIFLVCGGNSVGEFLRILGNGEDFGLKQLNYAYQKEAGGIAQALSLAEDWADREPVAVILSDNFYEENLTEQVKAFDKRPEGATIFAVTVDNPEHYGCLEFDSNNKVTSIVEKPKEPKTNWIQTGLYFYDREVWDYIKELKPSGRGELEITDVNNFYLKQNRLKVEFLKGWWGDMGESIDVYQNSSAKIAELMRANQKT